MPRASLPRLSTGVLLLLAAACANAPRSTIHRHDAIGLRGVLADGLQTNRPDPRRADQRLQGVHETAWGVSFEHFLDAGTSTFFELSRRAWPTAAADARVLELRSGGREFFRPDARLQPFLEASLNLAALDIDGAGGLSWGIGAAAGGGLRHFLGDAISLDLALLFAGMTVDPQTHRTSHGDRFASEEELYGWQLALQLAFLF